MKQLNMHKSHHNQRIISICLIAFFILLSCKSHYPLADATYTVHKNDHSLDRGKNLVYNVCGQCHYNIEAKKFSGKRMKDLPGFMGKVYSANLTNDPINGILKDYSNAQLEYLLKTGISNKGKFIPYMIRPTMADQDLNDIIVYLRSGDEPLQTDGKDPGNTKLSAFGKMAIKFSGKPIPEKCGIPNPNENNAVEYGRYLVDIMSCYHCHSRSILGLNYTEPEKSKGYMAGGMKWKIDGHKIYASNLTPDKQTGIGNYSSADFLKAVHEKIGKGDRPLHSPMPKFPHLTDKQANAIYAYLMQLPPKEHKIKGHSK